MTLDCGDPFDAAGFAIERAKSLGLKPRQLTCKAILCGFGCNQGVLVTRDRPGKSPKWFVFDPREPAAKALDWFLNCI